MKGFTVITATLLCGCATGQMSQLEADISSTTPFCVEAKECEQKWEVAQAFVQRHAGMKLQTVTSIVIETHNPPPYGVELAMSVTRVPIGEGRYRFEARAWCANLFGCQPAAGPTVLALHEAINSIR